MERLALIQKLIAMLLEGMPECRKQAASFGEDEHSQRQLLRGLMNMRQVKAGIPEGFLPLQDELLSKEREERELIEVMSLPACKLNPMISAAPGDIINFKADAIVNAANSSLLGCFMAGHACIDNAIHSYAGLQMRFDCHEIIKKQGHQEKTGTAKITRGYNLPARYVLHTVGPVVSWKVTPRDQELLKSCYLSCLKLCRLNKLKSVVFCGISTGVFGYPKLEAAELAVATVCRDLKEHDNDLKVVFNTYTKQDEENYDKFLNPHPVNKDEHLRPVFHPSLF